MNMGSRGRNEDGSKKKKNSGEGSTTMDSGDDDLSTEDFGGDSGAEDSGDNSGTMESETVSMEEEEKKTPTPKESKFLPIATEGKLRTSDDGNVSIVTRNSERSSQQANDVAALAVALPLVMVIFAVLLFVAFIFIWKKILKRQAVKQGSVKSDNNNVIQEVAVKDKLKDTSSVQSSVASSTNYYTDLDSDKNRTGGALAIKNNAVEDAQYAEVDETPLPVFKDSTPQEGSISQPVNSKVGPKESHEYEEAVVQVTQSNDEYEEAKFEGTQSNHGYEETKDKGKQDGQGNAMSKVTAPLYHTLEPDDPSDSSYMSVSMNKQDEGYDTLKRMQNPSKAQSKTNSDYDHTERIRKGGVTFGPSNQIDSEYSVPGSRSANTSAYDMLDRERRSHEPSNISPNEYNILHPQASG